MREGAARILGKVARVLAFVLVAYVGTTGAALLLLGACVLARRTLQPRELS